MDTPPLELVCADDVFMRAWLDVKVIDISASKVNNRIAALVVDGTIEMYK